MGLKGVWVAPQIEIPNEHIDSERSEESPCFPEFKSSFQAKRLESHSEYFVVLLFSFSAKSKRTARMISQTTKKPPSITRWRF